MKTLNHIGIIMDGNGRWAQMKKKPRSVGHNHGVGVAKDILDAARELNIKNITLYAFSSENWLRPPTEVSLLMKLLGETITKNRIKLVEKNVRLHCIGDLKKLPETIQSELNKLLEETAHCTGANLILALSYGGRQEILNTAIRLAQMACRGEIKPEDIDESVFENNLPSAMFPPPELIIRTGGEFRLSNFLLWQSAYSEIYVTKKLWPDFTKADLFDAVEDFQQRNRRFGMTQEQVQQSLSPHKLQ